MIVRHTKASMMRLDTASAMGKEGWWRQEGQTELSKFLGFRREVINLSDCRFLVRLLVDSN